MSPNFIFCAESCPPPSQNLHRLARVTPVQYRLTSPLHWRQLDEDWVVYQHGTGHMAPLDPVAATITSFLEDGPAPLDWLVRRLAEHAELPADAMLERAVCAVLEPLCQTGLVTRGNDALSW